MKILFLILFAVSPVFAGNSTRHLPPSERYLPVVKQIVKFAEFLQTEAFAIHHLEEQKALNLSSVRDNLQRDLALAELFSEWGEELLSGRISGDVILRQVLQERFDILREAESVFRLSDHIFDTVETFLRFKKVLTPIDSECEDKTISYVHTRFQFLGLIVKKLFEVLELDELSLETKRLIRASVSLWPLLKGETRSLGNPLFDAGMLAIVEAYYEVSHTRPCPDLSIRSVRFRFIS